MTLTATEFNEAVDSAWNKNELKEEGSYYFREFIEYMEELEGVGKLSLVHQGREGDDADQWPMVFKTENNQHFRIVGDYSSWDGVDLDWSYHKFEEVFPYEHTEIRYSSTKKA